MTKQEAKNLSLEIWEYLAEHSEIKIKKETTQKIVEIIEAWEPE